MSDYQNQYQYYKRLYLDLKQQIGKGGFDPTTMLPKVKLDYRRCRPEECTILLIGATKDEDHIAKYTSQQRCHVFTVDLVDEERMGPTHLQGDLNRLEFLREVSTEFRNCIDKVIFDTSVIKFLKKEIWNASNPESIGFQFLTDIVKSGGKVFFEGAFENSFSLPAFEIPQDIMEQMRSGRFIPDQLIGRYTKEVTPHEMFSHIVEPVTVRFTVHPFGVRNIEEYLSLVHANYRHNSSVLRGRSFSEPIASAIAENFPFNVEVKEASDHPYPLPGVKDRVLVYLELTKR